jgi:hypothetical protein
LNTAAEKLENQLLQKEIATRSEKHVGQIIVMAAK